MKRIASAIIAVMILGFGSALFAQESSIDVKLGAGYPDAPGKVGFDAAVDFNLGLDKFFNLGIETGFSWIQWKDEGFAQQAYDLPLAQVEKANLYSIPVLAIASVRFANVKESYGFMPFISGGAGYSWTFYNHPEFNDTFHGFTWQASAGSVFALGEGSALNVIVEIGYKGAAIQNSDDLELNMSGPFGRLGLSFPLVVE